MGAHEARARRTDPATSHKAAEAFNRSGKAQTQADEIVALIGRYPGRTSAELVALSDGRFDRYQVARPLRSFCKTGLIREGAARDCKQTRKEFLTWLPAIERERDGHGRLPI